MKEEQNVRAVEGRSATDLDSTCMLRHTRTS